MTRELTSREKHEILDRLCPPSRTSEINREIRGLVRSMFRDGADIENTTKKIVTLSLEKERLITPQILRNN
jgi:hypothetical protein